MKAIILSAGQGKRLLPLTETQPKCLIEVAPGTSMLGWQLLQLAEAGIEEAVIVTGFHADKVEAETASRDFGLKVRCLYNPLYKAADNLGSVQAALDEMTGPFLLLNGDTLFHRDVPLALSENRSPVTVTISRKSGYDSDDMKVCLDETGRLTRVGKALDVAAVDAESIGMMMFQGQGIAAFRAAVERAWKAEDGRRVWYLSVIDRMADERAISTCEVAANAWCEVDFPVDLKRARESVALWQDELAGAALQEA